MNVFLVLVQWWRRFGFSACSVRLNPYKKSLMTRLSAKVLIVDRLGDQYLITVQVSEKYPCTFDRLTFGDIRPRFGSYRYGWLDLVYHEDPLLQAGQSFPLWAIE
jgi:hypothetical protein